MPYVPERIKDKKKRRWICVESVFELFTLFMYCGMYPDEDDVEKCGLEAAAGHIKRAF